MNTENSSLGSVIRTAREKRGYSIEEVAEKTRIKPDIIEHLEQDNYAELPSPVYVKGFLKMLAQCLQTDQALLTELYMNSAKPQLQQKIFAGQGKRLIRMQHVQTRSRTHSAIIAGILSFIAVLALLYGLYVFFNKGAHPATKPSPAMQKTAVIPQAAEPQTGLPIPFDITSEKLSLQASVASPLWSRVKSDDQIVFEGMLAKGDKKTWEAKDTFSLKIGNASGIKFSLNGVEFGPLGIQGEVLDIIVDRKGVRKA